MRTGQYLTAFAVAGLSVSLFGCGAPSDAPASGAQVIPPVAGPAVRSAVIEGSATYRERIEPVAIPPASVAAAEPDPRDPWRDAQRRGIAYRAVGNEPGWFAEVGDGEAAALRATLDYGERTIAVARSVSLGSTRGYGGSTADGLAVTLRVFPETCSDGMSDATYPTRAELSVGSQRYSGCGRFLRN